MNDPTLDPDNLDEDLFSFGSMNPVAEGIFADEVEEVAGEEPEAGAPTEEAAPDLSVVDEFENPFDFDSITAAQDATAGGTIAAAPTPAAQAGVDSMAGAGTAAPGAPVAAGAAGPSMAPASSRTQLALAVMVAFNLLLVGLSWRSQGSTRALIESMGSAPAPAEATAEERLSPLTSRPQALDLPIADMRAEGYETLDEAARAIERGEFQLAREMLFALLAVIDRVEDTARYDVEARASFLIGDAYRFEADALVLAVGDSAGGQL